MNEEIPNFTDAIEKKQVQLFLNIDAYRNFSECICS